MGINTKDVIDLIIRPALNGIMMCSESAIQLLAGTCAQESQMGTYLKQIEGPAKGIMQMEDVTHDDIHNTYLRYSQDLTALLYSTCGMVPRNVGTIPDSSILIYNMRYAVCMARIKYARSSKPMPALGDTVAQANYWKDLYNSASGKGDTAAYILNYNRFVKPYYT